MQGVPPFLASLVVNMQRGSLPAKLKIPQLWQMQLHTVGTFFWLAVVGLSVFRVWGLQF